MKEDIQNIKNVWNRKKLIIWNQKLLVLIFKVFTRYGQINEAIFLESQFVKNIPDDNQTSKIHVFDEKKSGPTEIRTRYENQWQNTLQMQAG